MSTLVRKVVRDLVRRRVRTALTLTGIIVGVAGLVAVSAAARQLGVAQRSLVDAGDHPDLTVQTTPLAAQTSSLVSRQLGASLVESRVIQDTTFSDGGAWRNSLLIGIDDFTTPGLQRPTLVSGRLPAAGEVAFDEGVAALAELDLGDLVAFRSAAGQPVAYLTVVGFTRTPATLDAGILNRVNAYTTANQVETMLGRRGANQLLVKLAGDVDPNVAGGDLGRLLDHRGIGHGSVFDQDQDVIGSRELRTIVWLLLVFSILGLILSGFLVANTVAAVVHDEFRQIGLLKALGGTRPRVVAVYLAPALLLGGIGTVLGYAVGLAGGQAIVAFLTRLIGYPLPALAITLREVGLALAVGLGVPVAAAVVPAVLGARLPVVRLLQSYGLATASRGRSGGIVPRLVGRRSPLSAMAIRNTLRRRLRAGITTALIAIAVAAAIASQGLSSSLEGTIATLYDRYGADAWVPFAVPVDDALAATVAREPGVVAAEPWARATGYALGRSIDLWGMPPATGIYDYRLVTGEWLHEGDLRAVVVSANLARRLDLTPGETLALDLGEETRDLTIIGIVDDESTYLGSTDAGKLFLPSRALDGIGGSRAFAFLAVQFERHDPASVETAIARLEERFADLHPQPYAAYTDQESTARSVDVLVVLLRAMVTLVALTGIVGVVNTQAMNVAERRREVGVVRALGAGRRHLATLLIGEGLVLGLFGFGLGLIAGYPLARLLVHLTGDVLFRLSFSLPAPFLAILLLATLAGCAAASVGPALLAARVRPTEVLRYE